MSAKSLTRVFAASFRGKVWREVFRQTVAHEGSGTMTGSLYRQTPTNRALR
jgi:hypothetical protein